VIVSNRHLQDASDIEISYIVNKLNTLLSLPQDEIIKQGDAGKFLYFISSGSVEVLLVKEVPA